MDCQSIWIHVDWPYELSFHGLYKEKKKEGSKKKKRKSKVRIFKIWIVNPYGYGFIRIDHTNCQFIDYTKKERKEQRRKKKKKGKARIF